MGSSLITRHRPPCSYNWWERHEQYPQSAHAQGLFIFQGYRVLSAVLVTTGAGISSVDSPRSIYVGHSIMSWSYFTFFSSSYISLSKPSMNVGFSSGSAITSHELTHLNLTVVALLTLAKLSHPSNAYYTKQWNTWNVGQLLGIVKLWTIWNVELPRYPPFT